MSLEDAVANEPTELEVLKIQANTLGIKYHANIGLTALKEKVAKALADEPAPAAPSEPAVETRAAKGQRLRKEANKLVRVQLTCMNPAKKEWPGEPISVSNSFIGTITKFIHFNAEDGYHIPTAILNVLRDRKYQAFKTVKLSNGQKVKKSFLAKEFAIDILDDLTMDELKALAAKQALANNGEE